MIPRKFSTLLILPLIFGSVGCADPAGVASLLADAAKKTDSESSDTLSAVKQAVAGQSGGTNSTSDTASGGGLGSGTKTTDATKKEEEKDKKTSS